MLPARDALWNVPLWAELFLYLSQALGILILIFRMRRRWQLWKQGEGSFPEEPFRSRLSRVWKYALRQIRVTRERYAGLMHLAVTVSVLVMLLGTILAFIDYDIGEKILALRLPILRGNFYLIYELVLDGFTILGIVGFAMALLRRAIKRPERLTAHSRFTTMSVFLLVTFINGLLIESIRLSVVNPDWGRWSFAGYALSPLWTEVPLKTLVNLHTALWVFHVFTVFLLWVLFLDLPTKHIITSTLKIFYSPAKELGVPSYLDIEEERLETFGVKAITDFTPLKLLSGDACTECGRCESACPAYESGTELNPKQIILEIRAGLDQLTGRKGESRSESHQSDVIITGQLISENAIWACTSCGACVDECPVLIDPMDSILDMRRYLTLTEGNIPRTLASTMTQTERNGNPWGIAAGHRLDWADGLDVPVISKKGRADILYWVGCAGAFDPKNQLTSRAMVEIFSAADVDYAVLGEEEACNCEWARRAGNEYLFQQAAHRMIDILGKYQFNTIVTQCPHCFNTFKNEYPQFGGHYAIQHHSTYIRDLLRNGSLTVTRHNLKTLTLQDACYLGRYNDIYDDPREVLKKTSTSIPIEMRRHGAKSLCCGGGGAQIWIDKVQENPINRIRLTEALQTGAETICTTCPFCSMMFSEPGAMREGSGIEIVDIAVLVADSIR